MRYLISQIEAQRSGFDLKRRSSGVQRAFAHRAEATTRRLRRRRPSSSGCRGYSVCFSKPHENVGHKAQEALSGPLHHRLWRRSPSPFRGGKGKRAPRKAPLKGELAAAKRLRRASPAAGDLCLRKKDKETRFASAAPLRGVMPALRRVCRRLANWVPERIENAKKGSKNHE